MSTHYVGMPARGPKPHQIIGQLITQYLWDETDRRDWVPIHEANLNDLDETSMAPDVTVFDASDAQPVVIVEITNDTGRNKTIRKCRQIMLDYPSITEAFVVVYQPEGEFDFEVKQWLKLTPDGNSDDEPDWSEVLQLELSEALDE